MTDIKPISDEGIEKLITIHTVLLFNNLKNSNNTYEKVLYEHITVEKTMILRIYAQDAEIKRLRKTLIKIA